VAAVSNGGEQECREATEATFKEKKGELEHLVSS